MQHQSFIRAETTVSLIFNTVFCGFFAWFPFRDMETIPLWGGMGMAADLIPTVFMIVFMTSNAETFRVRRAIAANQIEPLPESIYTRLAFFNHFISRSFVFGLIASLILIPTTVLVFVIAGIHALPFITFVIYKLVFGACLALLATPIILRVALSEKPNDAAQPA